MLKREADKVASHYLNKFERIRLKTLQQQHNYRV
jgi:hypothetical protein